MKNGDQRPAPETYPARAEIPKITGQRLGHANLTRGNVADSHTPGNNTLETGLPGWGTLWDKADAAAKTRHDEIGPIDYRYLSLTKFRGDPKESGQ